MSIYTKKGDQGKTSVIEAKNKLRRLSKSSRQVAAIGSIDELNSYLGIIVSISDNQQLITRIKEIQEDLLTIGSIIGGSNLRFFLSKSKKIEKEIDRLERKLDSLKQFIIPGGSVVASHLHFARTVCRRAERQLVNLNEIDKVKPQILTFINRLSDYLFVLARDVNSKEGVKDRVWVRSKK